MSIQTYYTIGAVETKHSLRIGNHVLPLNMKWAPGMVGVLAVFDDAEKAKEYAGDGYAILEFQAKPKEDDE